MTVLKLYEMLLSAFNHEIIGMAKNGQEAVDMYKNFSKKPDLIIMDHRKPIKNGLEASKEILELNGDAKIIFASADNAVKEFAQKIGALCFKSKPFSNEKLLNNINKAMQLINHPTIV